MRNALILLFIGVLQAHAIDTYSQKTRLSLNFSETELVKVLDKIEDESEFFFLYNEKLLDTERKVNVTANDQLIDVILDNLFSGTDVKYTIIDRKIILAPEYLTKETDAASIMQQQIVIGKITDSQTGEAMPGVNIMVKGTTIGAIADAEGKYSLSVTDRNAILVFSFIGYIAQEIPLNGRATIDVALVGEVTSLEEVVVIGYGTQTRKSLTGSISTVNATELSEGTDPNPIARMQGRASGILIIESHTPGANATIRIRGMGTINDANPLWVVDGVPGDQAVSPVDIETISVLKDAAAQAIYGARAANGVILVTTKSGKRNQKAQINLDVKQGISWNSNYFDVLNTKEFGEMLWLEAKNMGITNFSHAQYGNGATPVIPDYISPAGAAEGSAGVNPALYDHLMNHLDGTDTYLIMKANKEGTNWFKEADRVAKYKEYNLDISGGSANTTYAFQLGYLDQEGIMKWTGYDRYSFRSNISTNPAKWIEIGENVGIVFQNHYGYQTENADGSVIKSCFAMQPIIPVYDIMGNYAGTRAPSTGVGSNPIFQLDTRQHDFVKNLGLNGSTYIKFNIMEGLVVRSLIGINYYAEHGKNFSFNEVATAQRGKYDSLSENAKFGLQWTWTNTIEYSKKFADVHDLKVIIGSEAIDNNSNYLSGSRSEFFSQDINYMTLNTGIQAINNSGSNNAWSLYSMFGRLNYTFSDKYLLEGVVRRDGSSRFGTNKFGIFPAFSVGWRVSEESFMASTSNWLDQLKIRAGYGLIGNDRVGNYNSYTVFGLDPGLTFYPIDGSNLTTGAIGFAQNSFGQNDVRWETTKTANFGVDASLFKKLNLVVDLWQRVTSDMLYPKQMPMILGIVSPPSINIGEMKNRGFDIELGYFNSALNNKLTYSVDLVFSHYKNEIVSLSDKATEILNGSDYRGQVYTRTQSGREFPEFFGYIVDGIFQTQAEADAHPKAFGATGNYNKPGHYIYRDVNGDNVIDANDRTYIGSPHPDFTAGLNFNISYKGIGLSTQLYTSYGNDLVNYGKRWLDYIILIGNYSHDRLYNSWGSPYLTDNTKAKLPMAEQSDAASQMGSTAFISDGSYLRMKNLRLSYDLNSVLKGKFRNLQVYAQVTNLFTLTKYSGLDPEFNEANPINMGIDYGAWPTPKQFMFGITLGI